MKTLGSRIAHYRTTAGLSQASLAKACGWKSQSRIGNYEKDAREPSLQDLETIAKALRVPVAELTHGAREQSNVEPGPAITRPFKSVPIVGTAQMGTEGYWHALDEADGFVDVPSNDPNAYALRLRGDSMAPAIRSGWVAIIEPGGQLIPGEYVMIRLHDGESMLKELLYANDMEVSVMSINQTYARRTIPIEEIEQIHAVGGIVPPSKVRM